MNAPAVKTRAVRRAPPRIARGVGKLMATLAQKTGAMDPALLEAWPDIVGPDLCKMCRPVRLKRVGKAHTLVVSANSGAAAMRIQFSQADLLARTRQFLRMPTLTKLAIEQRPHSRTGQKNGGKRGGKPKGRFRTQSLTLADLPGPKDTEPAPLPPARDVSEALDRLGRAIAERALKEQ
ncbi:MAG: DUF721 domain-containing protein [Parvularcula sp.]